MSDGLGYGRIRTPVFYVDAVNWLALGGLDKSSDITEKSASTQIASGSLYDLFDLNPYNTVTFDTSGETAHVYIQIDTGLTDNIPINFIAILNHNLDSATADLYVANSTSAFSNDTSEQGTEIASPTDVINKYIAYGGADGDTIVTFTPVTDRRYWMIEIQDASTFAADITIGAIILGYAYTMPYSPEQNGLVGPAFMNESIDVRQSRAGRRHRTAGYTGANAGSAYAPFLRSTAQYRLNGRRYYEMTFPVMADTGTFPSNLRPSSTDTDESTFLRSVVNKTGNGLLPFIFCADSASTTDGDFMFASCPSFQDFRPVQDSANVHTYSLRIEQEL